jgi:hypothetical protein
VFPTRYVAVNRAPAESPHHIESLRNASRILAPARCGAAQAAAAAKVPAFKTDTSVTTEAALSGLRADAKSVALLTLFDALASKRQDAQLQLGVVLGDRRSVAFAVREADGALLRALNAHLVALRAAPSYRLLLTRAFGEDSLRMLARSHLDVNDCSTACTSKADSPRPNSRRSPRRS